MSILLFLAALAGASAPSAAESADGRCIVLLGYVGAHGSPAQAANSKTMLAFYVGKLLGRDPNAAVAALIVRSANQAKAQGINASVEARRCEAEFKAGTASLQGVRAAAGLPATPHRP